MDSDDTPPPAANEQPQGQRPAPEVDIQQLAERVYQLMLADLRLERARGAVVRRDRR